MAVLTGRAGAGAAARGADGATSGSATSGAPSIAAAIAASTRDTVCASELPSLWMITASPAARSGATARPRSRASRARSSSRTAAASAPSGSRPRSSIRRVARSSTEASRNSLRSASGRMTVPMSRPATMIPPSAASARWRGISAARTSGTMATADTAASTSCVLAASVASTPSIRTRVRRPEPSSASVTRSTRALRPGASSVATPSRSASAVIARYSRPVSTNRSPRRSAAAAPTLLLPLEAGPSMATTRRRPPDAGSAGSAVAGSGFRAVRLAMDRAYRPSPRGQR